MSAITATEAKNRFGQLLELSRSEPVHIQKNGRDVAVLLSPDEYKRLAEQAGKPKVRPEVERLLQESVRRYGKVYEALAK